MIHLIYAGRRKHTNKAVYTYYEIDMVTTGIGKALAFKKKLVPCAIGSIISCEETETGVKGPYKFAKMDDKIWREHNMDHLVANYSVLERSDLQLLEEIKIANEEYPEHIDEQIKRLVRTVRDNTFDRRRVALYVYTKILNG